VEVLDRCYQAITTVVEGLDADGLERPTRCSGWCVRDLLLHLLFDAQRALVAFATPAAEPGDVDFVSYWKPFRPDVGDGGSAHAEITRRMSAAWRDRPDWLVQQWGETSRAAVRAARSCPHERIATQGHVLALGDFVDTLVVEAVVHHLDMTVRLAAPPPDADGLAVVRRTLDGLLGAPVKAGWTDQEYALKGTGRVALSEADRAALGAQAGALPLLG
jgi:uncharacterized protein (TIGR03083 family)